MITPTRLDGQIAFITGVAGGQGRVAAELFASEGAAIVGCDISEEGVADTARRVRAAGGRIITSAPVDLADPAAATAWISAGVDAFGGIDILYNNAGAARFGTIPELRPEDWAFTLRNELELVVWTTQAAWPHLIARGGGTIVNTASTVALQGSATLGIAAHAAAKAGLIALTVQMAAEGARHRIRANSISPGGVETPALQELRSRGELPAVPQPLGRIGQPLDIVRCALYLASREADWVTAANVVVDGGMTMIGGVEPTPQ